MLRLLGRLVLVLLTVVVVLAILLGGFGYVTTRRSFPKVDGEIYLPGLTAPVEVYRDGYGVPHIYARTSHDLFLAQGYVHAQDRFWQMDFWRHLGSGRLSELFGESQVETDTFLRTLGWARVTAEEIEQLDPVSREILVSYTEGVNAYLVERQGSALSLEYAVLKLQNGGYRPEAWQPLHTLTWAKAMAWDLGGNMRFEQLRAALLKTLTPEQVDDLFLPYPDDHPVIVPGFQVDSGGGAAAQPASQAPAPAGYGWATIGSGLEAVGRQSAALEALMGSWPGNTRRPGVRLSESIGSNSWAISGERTATGQPILANDPHLGVQMPSIWYEVGLHCMPQGPDCPYSVTGVSFAGVPGVVIGHNDRIAWAFTNVGPDVQDLYIEKINPANPEQYEYEGQWVDMDTVQETIRVAGGDPVQITVRYTRHGPLLWQESLDQFREAVGLDLPEPFGIALRWTALDPGSTFQAVWRMNRANNWEEFREAVSYFDVPSQNMLYADVEGNIGYQTPGKIPIRAPGHTGELPVPGWTGENEWQGFIPFEALPRSFNPPEGYIVTANNAVVGPDYPYSISTNWDPGFRAQRIVDLIEGAPALIDLAYVQQMQGDNRSPMADELLPVLLGLSLDEGPGGAGPRLAAARALLESWDGQEDMDCAAAALFEVFWKHLLFATFDELGEDNLPEGGAGWYEIVRCLVPRPDDAWWDVAATAEVEGRDAVFRQAFAAAVDELEERQGEDPAGWRWCDLHTVTFRNASFGESGIAPIEAIFNRGPYPCAGGEGIVNATGWDATEGYQVDWIPSMRLIVDLSYLGNSLMMHSTGQSGHAYHPHYIDMADPWRNIEYHPMLWYWAQVEGAQEAHLTLLP